MVAHGVSRGKNALRTSPGKGGRSPDVFRPCRGLSENYKIQRLAPWATLSRCSAATAEITVSVR